MKTLAHDAARLRPLARSNAGVLVLIAFCGLPGTGKTTLARGLASRLRAVYLRIDSIEETLLAGGGASLVEGGAGYAVAYAIAEDNLKLGRTVVADCVNPIEVTREAWQSVAKRSGVVLVDVFVICSDSTLHQSRIAARPLEARGSKWSEIRSREFDPVRGAAIVIDTSNCPVEQCLDSLQSALQARMRQSH